MKMRVAVFDRRWVMITPLKVLSKVATTSVQVVLVQKSGLTPNKVLSHNVGYGIVQKCLQRRRKKLYPLPGEVSGYNSLPPLDRYTTFTVESKALY